MPPEHGQDPERASMLAGDAAKNPDASSGGPVMRLRALHRVRRLQDRLVRLLGSSADTRPDVVAGMLARNANEATSYWLQLFVSIGIATLGLVVGSAAVIIGAMLVAPLMSPIVALAMGLATGSPFLVLRAATRIVLSVALAVGGAALITVLLPFHELNAEIAARTSPTLLDLVTASFCALAGVYASLRPGSDTATTAAGTSIGISLVPPLCASGYGLGTTSWVVAGGAALLFLTNLVAIIFVGTLSFMAAGFNRVSVARLEREELAKHHDAIVTTAISRRLTGLFESQAGPALRFLMPLLLLTAVYAPLRRALDEVAWQVRTRAAVQRAIGREPHKVVQSRVRVERHTVDLLLVLVGKSADAETARARLDQEIREASGVAPRIEVLAIPDATAFAGLESTLLMPQDRLQVPRPPPPPPSPAERLHASRTLVQSAIASYWPVAAAGDPLAVDVATGEAEQLRVRVVHLGPALGSDAVEVLGRSLGESLGLAVQVVDVSIPVDVLTRADGDLAFVSRVSAGVRASAPLDQLSVCVIKPGAADKRRRPDKRDEELADALDAVLAGHPRVGTAIADEWSVQFVRGSCPASAASDAGAPGAGAP
jgi:uncharacterized hydrophobic protein (TIGR00271 family)